MKALVKQEPRPGLWLAEVPVPAPGPNDVLIRLRKTAICGTDIHIYNWDDWAQATIPAPMIIGHEFAGEIAGLGSAVTGFCPGDRVSAEGHVTCGHCRNCRAGRQHLCCNTSGVGVNRPGCFADYVSVPAANVYPLPDDISDDIGAILDPFGNAAHSALSFDLTGEDVLITGAGPIGVLAVAIARHVGARHVVITDVNDYRLALAARMGASRAVNIARDSLKEVMAGLGMCEGFDVGLEMSGAPGALRDLLELMNHGGKVALLGIPSQPAAIDWSDVILKGLTLKGIYGREMYETWYKMVAMIQSGLKLAQVITHHFPVARFKEAFELMKSGQSGKVILDWDS
jgi:threonine 3-dehydrogenase